MSQISIRSKLNKIFNLDSPSRLRSFEGLRAWAIIMVFNVHFFAQYYQQHYFVQANSFAEGVIKVLHAGHIGVDLFFVLSGFLIYSTLQRNKPTFRSYIGHRIYRIMPAHIAVLFLLVFPNIHWGKLLANIVFLPTFIPPIREINFVTWTLGWEWLFYVLMFGIMYSKLGVYRGAMLVLSILLVLSLLLGVSYKWGELIGWGDRIGVSRMMIILPEPGRFAGFFIGVIVAHLLASQSGKALVQRAAKKIWLIAIIGVLLAQFGWSIYAPQINGSFVLCNLFYLATSLCFGAIVAHLATNNSDGILNWLFQSTLMRIVGQTSYSFYLIHGLVTIPLISLIAGMASTFSEMCLHYVVGFVFTVILSTMSFYYLERPYLLSKRK